MKRYGIFLIMALLSLASPLCGAEPPEYYLNLSKMSSPPDSYRLQLKAAEQWIAQGQPANATPILNSLPSDMEPTLYIEKQTLLAEINFANHQYTTTLSLLEGTRTLKRIPPDFQLRITQMRAVALDQTGNPIESVRERVLLDTLLADPEKIVANRKAIWSTLTKLGPHTLKWIHIEPAPHVFGGWVALAYISQQYTDNPDELSMAVAAWQKSYPHHPAQTLLPSLIPTLAPPDLSTTPPPRKIALLLPFSGPYAPVSAAIRDGVLSAYYQSAHKPILALYDTTQRSSVRKTYFQAIEEGADRVIGPLTKEEVKQIIDISDSDLSVHTIALNTPDKGTITAPKLFAFSLAPEQEAESVAARLITDRAFYVGLIAGASNSNQRSQSAFQKTLEAEGGLIAQTISVNTSDDPSGAIRQLLHIDASQRRHAELKRVLSAPLQFQPRRRQDLNALVLLASADQDRQIRPLLDFYYAENIPVYATSTVYTGTPNAKRDQDLNRIVFCDMPWMINPQSPQHHTYQMLHRLWPERMETQARLFAFGIDAYQLSLATPQLAAFPNFGFNGATGKLYQDSNHRIARQLGWAKMQNGTPKWMNPS